ncbi:DUF7282 domain-containing protein [Haloarchaeobius litoreus]|uniref:PGF-CTERM sorting domain-containing protein n=1 Tax=Haloarchaeobius litoreus TaxID=755306 RepID=A0ABD6DMR0_9EURY|nr:PGF-CTERM sorting domain-containing protein [Haloarchaeobius litoreus]
MPQSPRTVTVVTLLVVTATLLPVVGVATVGHGDTAELNSPTDTLPRNDTTVRLHRVPNGTSPTSLPDHVGLDEPSDPVFFPGDRLVVTVQSQALARNVSNASGASLTERFAATQTNGSRLWVTQTNPTPQQEPKVVDLSDAANLTVVAGDRPATYHVVVDTWAVETVYGDPADAELHAAELRPEEEFYAGFDEFPDGEPPMNRTISVGTADIDVPGGYRSEVYRLQPEANATVSGDAVLPPSTPVTVELVNATTGRVVASDRATVERTDGGDSTEFRFTAGLNLTGEYGDGYELHVRSNGTGIGDAVPAAVHPREASLSFRNDTARWGTTVENATLTWGGFVVLREVGDPAVFLGASSYVYPGTEPEQVGVQFDDAIDEPTTVVAVAYRDVDRDGEFDQADEPYLHNGEPVTAMAVVEPPEETATPTATPTSSATPTPRDVGTTATTDTATTPTLGMSDPDDTDDDGSIPGFGVSGTLAALLALGALGVRRR